jgi:thioredoxin 1
MTRAIFIQLLTGLLIGGSLGAIMGYVGKCSSGTCPLTANPWRGAFLGALIGGLFAWTSGSSISAAEAAEGGRAAVHISSVADFESRVIHAAKPALVDFYSNSCPPCRKLAPTIDRLAKQYEGRAVICKVDVTKLPQLATRYGVEGIPTVLFIKDGREVQRLVGAYPQGTYAGILDAPQRRP